MWRWLLRHLLSLLATVSSEGDKIRRKGYIRAPGEFCHKGPPSPWHVVILLPLPDRNLGDLAPRQLAQLAGHASRAAELVDQLGFCTHGPIMGYGFPLVKQEIPSRDVSCQPPENGKPFPGVAMSQKEKDPYAIECGDRLRRARVAAGFPIRRRFAEYMHEEENNIQKWENGSALVPAAFVRDLKPLGITHDWVYGGDASGMPQRLHVKLLSEDHRDKED